MVGKVIVASREDAIPNIIKDGKNGLLVRGEDEVKASEAIIRFYGDSKLRRSLIAQEIKNVHDKFNAKRVADEHERVFLSLLQGDSK